MQLISYTDKSALNVNPDIADVNKCNATDLNNIKAVVNNNAVECGDASDLNTIDKSSLVNGINEINNSKQATILSGTSLPGTATDGTIFLLYNS